MINQSNTDKDMETHYIDNNGILSEENEMDDFAKKKIVGKGNEKDDMENQPITDNDIESPTDKSTSKVDPHKHGGKTDRDSEEEVVDAIPAEQKDNAGREKMMDNIGGCHSNCSAQEEIDPLSSAMDTTQESIYDTKDDETMIESSQSTIFSTAEKFVTVTTLQTQMNLSNKATTSHSFNNNLATNLLTNNNTNISQKESARSVRYSKRSIQQRVLNLYVNFA